MQIRQLVCFLTIVASVFIASGAHAQLLFQRSWIDPNGGNYNDAGNWDSGIPDSTGEIANFDLNATYTVGFPTGAFTQAATVRDGMVTWDLDNSGTPTAYFLNGSLSVGPFFGGDPHLIVRDGTVLTPFLLVKDGGQLTQTNATINFDTGNAEVRGAGSTWTQTSGLLRIGESGSGDLHIGNGGRVENFDGIAIGRFSGGNGTVTVTGTGSLLEFHGNFTIGQEGFGSLVIEDGGTVMSGSFSNLGRIGFAAGAIGNVTVTGVDSNWTHTNGDLLVGEGGQGTLLIEAGATVLSDLGAIAHGVNSVGAVVTVTGTGSTWTNDLVIVGRVNGGTGTLRIEDGGKVISTNSGSSLFGGTIDGPSDSASTVTVHGVGSVWESNALFTVGGTGAGELSIEAGGWVTSGESLIGAAFGNSLDSEGTVVVSGAGSTWLINQTLSIGGGAGAGVPSTGVLEIRAGGSVHIADETELFPDGMLGLRGGILATPEIHFNGGGDFIWLPGFQGVAGTLHVDFFPDNLTTPDTGVLSPGRPAVGISDAAGSTTILGNYTQQAGGLLDIEIGGTATATQHDFVDITGVATLGGAIELHLINDFVPGPDDQFIVMNADDDLLGFFTNAGSGQRVDTTDGVGSFIVQYGPTSAFDPNQIVLSDFEPVCPADTDGNGIVDVTDLLALLAAWGDCPPPCPPTCGADINGDCVVDVSDLLSLLAAWGDCS